MTHTSTCNQQHVHTPHMLSTGAMSPAAHLLSRMPDQIGRR
jgi:hypothetical protein